MMRYVQLLCLLAFALMAVNAKREHKDCMSIVTGENMDSNTKACKVCGVTCETLEAMNKKFKTPPNLKNNPDDAKLVKQDCSGPDGKWHKWKLCWVAQSPIAPPKLTRQKKIKPKKQKQPKKPKKAMQSMYDLYDAYVEDDDTDGEYEHDYEENSLQDELDEMLNEMFLAGYNQGLAGVRKKQGYRYQN